MDIIATNLFIRTELKCVYLTCLIRYTQRNDWFSYLREYWSFIVLLDTVFPYAIKHLFCSSNTFVTSIQSVFSWNKYSELFLKQVVFCFGAENTCCVYIKERSNYITLAALENYFSAFEISSSILGTFFRSELENIIHFLKSALVWKIWYICLLAYMFQSIA